MLIQKSYKNNNKNLYIIPTPIGNLEDITLRIIKTLNEVQLVFCEDTRVTAKLLNHLEIKKPLKIYHEFNKEEATKNVIKEFETNDKIALVSDAGMPTISDPGYEFIKTLKENDINVIVLPGPTAFILPLVFSNIEKSKFNYEGFLSKKTEAKKTRLQEIYESNTTTVFYESTHKILKTLELIQNINSDIILCIGRELTKMHEEYIEGKVSEIIEYYTTNSIKGEFVVVMKPSYVKTENNTPIEKQIDTKIKNGMPPNEAIKQVAKENNTPKKEVYNIYHNIK